MLILNFSNKSILRMEYIAKRTTHKRIIFFWVPNIHEQTGRFIFPQQVRKKSHQCFCFGNIIRLNFNERDTFVAMLLKTNIIYFIAWCIPVRNTPVPPPIIPIVIA